MRRACGANLYHYSSQATAGAETLSASSCARALVMMRSMSLAGLRTRAEAFDAGIPAGDRPVLGCKQEYGRRGRRRPRLIHARDLERAASGSVRAVSATWRNISTICDER